MEFDDRKSLISSCDMTDRAICISGFKIILDKHDSSPDFEDETFRSETSFFEGFDKWERSLRVHIEDKYITRDSIESLSIIGIDRYISGEKLCMIFCLDRDIARFEKRERSCGHLSCTDFIQNSEKRIF